MVTITEGELRYQWIPWEQELDRDIHQAWRQLAALQRDVNPMQTPEYWGIARNIWPKETWRIILVCDGQHPLAVLPVTQKSWCSWAALDHMAKDYPLMLIAPGEEASAWMGIGRLLKQVPHMGQLLLGRCADIELVTQARDTTVAAGFASRQTPTLPRVETFLAESEETFFRKLTSKSRESIRCAENRLRRNYADLQVDIYTTPSPATTEALNALVNWYRQRWHEEIGGCLFDDPRMVEFFNKGLEQFLASGQGIVYTLRVDGRLIAVDTVVHQPGQRTAYLQFVARDAQALPPRYSPGIFLLLEVTRHLRTRGVESLQMGSGGLWYKLEFGGLYRQQYLLTAFHSPFAKAVIPPIERASHMLHRIPVHAVHNIRRIIRPVSHHAGD